MSETIEIRMPNIGDFEGVEIIEVLVAEGDSIAVEDSLITVESDKASMEIPSPEAGSIKAMHIKQGDKISEGDVILTLQPEAGAAAPAAAQASAPEPQASAAPAAVASNAGNADIQCDVLVLGAGPGGYTAAFRAADLGKKVVLVERYEVIGGVCLNVGCIPSKALLHTADVMNEAAELSSMGVTFDAPAIDLDVMRAGKDKVVGKLTGGLKMLAKQRKVQIITGVGRFSGSHELTVETQRGEQTIAFSHAIIACGSRAVQIPDFPNEDERLIDSTGALQLADVPKKMLVIGGGIIGLEMATVYSTLGSRIDLVELQNALIPGCDPDLVRPLQRRLQKQLENIMLSTGVTAIKAQKNGLKVSFEGKNAIKDTLYDKVLVAVGRRPNGALIDADKAGVVVDERGFIPVDAHMRTNVEHIFAIGDVVGNPMLAHKATHEAKVAAEVIAGLPALFDPMTIPSVAYTDPEVAWMGLTETQARADGIAYEKGVIPWAASGRALGIGREEGMTKLLFEPESKRILGAGIVGVNAGELIGEAVLALEMGADAEDIGLTIHPHPTLNETLCFAAEMAEGSITDLMPPKKRK
ncbi:MAG: dihydrolipoyl dehydrogenase [gamma proteobacterium symbiont of Bathyaustriella thionipta]|nr:dihydrolipoyl dehydrogenase [gamma proteobacterium symbiont of Bathyaustriella thionipta]